MNNKHKCKRCGKQLSADELRGYCQKCLDKIHLEDDEDEQP
jgi:Zn finger protein HypA/HybF involved in hydrogenase expression